jgi:hypothetical protein
VTLIAAIFLVLTVGKVILVLTSFEPVIWDSIQVLGLLSWVLGVVLAFQVMGWLPTITFG